MACGAFASAPSSGVTSAGYAKPPTEPMKTLPESFSTGSFKDDYNQLKYDWTRLRTQNKVALGVTAGIGAAAIVVVVILAIMLARRS